MLVLRENFDGSLAEQGNAECLVNFARRLDGAKWNHEEQN